MSDKTQFVLVETISQYRMRYVVEVPVGVDDYDNDRSLWALDTVTCDEAKEFSQEWLGETILSHRVVNKEEVLEIHATDHPDWIYQTDEEKFGAFVTEWIQPK
jgi:hypothetical protein